jgi:hypothetical protein
MWIRCKNRNNIGFAKIDVGFGFEMITLNINNDDSVA